MSFAFRIGARTDVGIKRDTNQDSYITSQQLCVVADGMGGHRGGEVASAIAVDEMLDSFETATLENMRAGVEAANKRILDVGAFNPALHGMGTTLVALGMIDVDGEIEIGGVHIGDSRMYRLSDGTLNQLTEDHSLVEALVREGRITALEAETHPQRNIVTRALGVSDYVEVDVFHYAPVIGHRYLLASDGLFNEVSAQDICTILDEEADPDAAASRLVTTANRDGKGGRDNITAVVVDIVADGQGAMPAIAHVAVELGESPDMVGAPSADETVTVSLDEPDQSSRNRWPWRR